MLLQVVSALISESWLNNGWNHRYAQPEHLGAPAHLTRQSERGNIGVLAPKKAFQLCVTVIASVSQYRLATRLGGQDAGLRSALPVHAARAPRGSRALDVRRASGGKWKFGRRKALRLKDIF